MSSSDRKRIELALKSIVVVAGDYFIKLEVPTHSLPRTLKFPWLGINSYLTIFFVMHFDLGPWNTVFWIVSSKYSGST